MAPGGLHPSLLQTSASAVQPISVPVMNSLVASNKVIVDQSLLSHTATAAPTAAAMAVAAAGAPGAGHAVDLAGGR
jgi:hypothetical protein